MFASFRKAKAQKAVLYAVRPLIAVATIRGPLSAGALLDPYFLGFIGLVSTFHCNQATGKLDHVGDAIEAVLKELSGRVEHRLLIQTFMHYATTKHPDYMRGQNDADELCGFTYGLRKAPSGEIVVVAPDDSAAQNLLQTKFLKALEQYR